MKPSEETNKALKTNPKEMEMNEPSKNSEEPSSRSLVNYENTETNKIREMMHE